MGDYQEMVQAALDEMDIKCSPFLTQRVDAPSDSANKPIRYEVVNMTSELCVVLLGSLLGIAVSWYFPAVPQAHKA